MTITAHRLIELEERFAPTIGAAPSVFSPHERTRTDPMNAGGDKMGPDRNGYADTYARLLDGMEPQRLVELGVFQGASMALWCDLFPEAEVVGLDLSLDRYHANVTELKGRGAFTVNSPLLHEWDAYSDDAEFLRDFGAIDVFVDDGPHTLDAIENVLRLVGPLMADGGVYVIEDFPGGGDLLRAVFPDAQVIYAGRLNAARL